MTEETKVGVCTNCEDEYDNPQETKLYGKRKLCGDCMTEHSNEAREYILAYGDN